MSSKFKNPRAKNNFVGRTCSITGVGSYVPEKILTNADLAKAAERAMKMAGVTAEQVDLIIVATLTPDMQFPSTACLVQRKIGAARAAAFDIEAACSGFIYALEIGQQFILSRSYETVLVMGADGNKADLLSMPGGGSACPTTLKSVADGLHFLRMDGKETFKSAVQAMVSAAHEAMRRCDVDITKIKCVIPHQANRRIIDAVGERLKTTPEQLFVNLEKYGNTSAASVAIALDEAVAAGKVSRGDLILLVVFGAGLTWGAAVIEW